MAKLFLCGQTFGLVDTRFIRHRYVEIAMLWLMDWAKTITGYCRDQQNPEGICNLVVLCRISKISICTCRYACIPFVTSCNRSFYCISRRITSSTNIFVTSPTTELGELVSRQELCVVRILLPSVHGLTLPMLVNLLNYNSVNVPKSVTNKLHYLKGLVVYKIIHSS